MAMHSWKVSTTILSLLAGAVSGFSVPKKNDFSARMIRPSKNCGSAARRRVSSLSVMSINFLNNGPGNKNDEDRDEDKEVERLSLSTMEEEDFSFLKQWPLMPEDPSPGGSSSNGDGTDLATRSKDTIESSRYRGTNPLANLVQLVEMVAPLDGSPKNESAKNSNIFNLADGLFRNVMDNAGGIFPSANEITTVQDLIAQEQWLDNLQLTLFDEGENATMPSSSTSSSRLSATQASTLAAAATSNSSSTRALDGLFQEATSRVEYLVQEASNLASPSVIPELMVQTRQLFAFLKSKEADETVKNPLLEVTEPEQLKETTTYAATFMTVANAIFAAGYVQDEAGALVAPLRTSSGTEEATAKPLLADFLSAKRIMPNDYPSVVMQGAEMGTLAGAIYEDTTRRTLALGHAIVARGTTANVAWMVTDSVVDGKMTRTLTIRGFDASDESVDREALLNVICTPEPVRLVDDKDILFHRGLLETAQAIYSDVGQYFDWTTANQKIILNGHSIGGSLSILLLLLMTEDRGVDYVNRKVARVFAHGNPPMATVLKRPRGMRDYLDCPVLKSFNLPSDIVFGYIQPYVSINSTQRPVDPCQFADFPLTQLKYCCRILLFGS